MPLLNPFLTPNAHHATRPLDLVRGNGFTTPPITIHPLKNSIHDIYETVYVKKSMPQGTSLSASDLQAFKSWYDAGYPSN